MKTTKENYESLTHLLIGDIVRKVVYHTLDDGFNNLAYKCRTPFDILDKALLFQMESGISCLFFSGFEFEQQGLDFVLEPCQYIKQSCLNNELHNVSSHKNWSSFIGQQITGIDCHWQDTHHIGVPLLYPKYIQLEFDNQQSIYLCSPYYHQQSTPFHVNPEELMVIFDEDTARSHLAMYMTDQPSHQSIPKYTNQIAV